MPTEPYVLTLSHWWSWRGITGDRWTLSFGGVSRVTRPTELECRRYAREMGWVVRIEDQV